MMSLSLGTMSVRKLFHWQDHSSGSLEQSIAEFLKLGEAIATRWIQTAKGVLLLQMVPGDPASGAIYFFDRRSDDWYMFSFEGPEDQFTSEQFDRVFREYALFQILKSPQVLAPMIPAHDA